MPPNSRVIHVMHSRHTPSCIQVDDDAPYEEVKKAYRSAAKECHPDFLNERGHDICVLLNEVGQHVPQ